jgi:hypothetical protein
MRRRRFRSRPRWVLPGSALVVAGAVLAGTMLASAAAPSLPRQTPAQLLAAMRQARLPAAMSATVSESADLGFPALPNIGGLSSSPLSAASLISGTHTVQVWYAGPRHLRIALPVSFGETDLRINGTQAWLWQSQGQKATHVIIPASRELTGPDKPGARGPEALGPLTPLQAAKKLLALVSPDSRVTVPGTTVVAGRDAYQLAIAPRSSQSLVGRILIAVDAKTHLPLSVQVFARGASSPAFQIGFTSLSFARPAMSNFTFTPPPGAKVKTVKVPAGDSGFMSGAGRMPGEPGFMPGTGRLPGESRLFRPPGGKILPGHASLAGVRTFGTGWLTVVAIPVGLMTHIPAAGQVHPGFGPSGGSNQSQAFSSGPGQGMSLFSLLLNVATPVRGPWGHGRLLRTSLLSVLVTSKGELLAGPVTPAVLYADAAKVK